MTTYKLKPEFEGLTIQTKVWAHNITLILDATKPVASEHLANFYRYEEFRQFIDVIEEPQAKKYTGVENKKTKGNGKESIQSPATDADSTATGGDDSQL